MHEVDDNYVQQQGPTLDISITIQSWAERGAHGFDLSCVRVLAWRDKQRPTRMLWRYVEMADADAAE